MPRPPIPEGEVIRIKTLYLKNRSQTATEIWQNDNKKHGRSKYEQWVREAREEIPPLLIHEETELIPWERVEHAQGTEDTELWADAEEVATLFRLRQISLRYTEYRLTPSVWGWARKLRSLFQGPCQNPLVNLDLELMGYSTEYALREGTCNAMNKPLYTDDLDGMMTFRIWESPKNHREWLNAVGGGAAAELPIEHRWADYGITTVETFVMWLNLLLDDLTIISFRRSEGPITEADQAMWDDHLIEIEMMREVPEAVKAMDIIAETWASTETKGTLEEEESDARTTEAAIQG